MAAAGSGDVRASDAERDAVVEQLSAACSEGRLTLGELEERVEQVLASRTRGELARATADLPPAAADPPAIPGASVALGVRSGTGLPGERPSWSISILGGTRRSGRWKLPRQLVQLSVLGSTRLDLEEAELPGPDASITIISLLGGTRVRVPQAVKTDVSGFSLLGGRHVQPPRPSSSTAPRVHLRVFSVLGGLRVQPTRSRRG
ncbi:MAG: DUF1707 SHOCT-like domain-containing protein [Acidimicrobiales bacterium]